MTKDLFRLIIATDFATEFLEHPSVKIDKELSEHF